MPSSSSAPPRSYLYVPADQERRLAGASSRGADALILDLEDAVAVSAKPAARELLASWLPSLVAPTPQLWVRINSTTPGEDITAVVTPPLSGIVLPKAEPELLADVDQLLARREQDLGLPVRTFAVIGLVESAAGLLALPDLAAGPRVARLGLGEADLAAALRLRPSPDRIELLPLRLQLVVASAAAGIDAPMGPTATDITDLEALRSSSEALLRMGYRSRTAIHPAQVPVINTAFSPTSEEVAVARRLVDLFAASEASGAGVLVDDAGRMVDEAVVRSAREVLTRADGADDDPSAGAQSP